MTKQDIYSNGQQPPAHLMNKLYMLMKDVGVAYEMKEMDRSEKAEYMVNLFNKIIMKNPYVPMNTNIEKAIDGFCDAMLYDDVDFRSRTIKGVITAFRMWIQKQSVRDKVVEAPMLPEKREMTVEEFSDEMIKSTIESYEKVMGMIGREKVSDFMTRVNNEAEKRNIKTKGIK